MARVVLQVAALLLALTVLVGAQLLLRHAPQDTSREGAETAPPLLADKVPDYSSLDISKGFPELQVRGSDELLNDTMRRLRSDLLDSSLPADLVPPSPILTIAE